MNTTATLDETTTAAQSLDDWRWATAMGSTNLTWGAPFVHSEVVKEYRRLVMEDVRPNPLRAFPSHVQYTVEEITKLMENVPSAAFFNRLPHVLSTLYEHGMCSGAVGEAEQTQLRQRADMGEDPFVNSIYGGEEVGVSELDARELFEAREKEFFAAGERLEEAAKICADINQRDTVHDTRSFADHLAQAVNYHSMENQSGTPDFILGEFLAAVLDQFGNAVRRRDEWQGRDDVFPPTPGWEYGSAPCPASPEAFERASDLRQQTASATEAAHRHPLRRHLDQLRARYAKNAEGI